MPTEAIFQFDLFDDLIAIPAIRNKLQPLDGKASDGKVYFEAPNIDLSVYDRIVICMSGGKDSIASILHLKELGVDMGKIELWHHDIDGREGSILMDWYFMASYNQSLASALGLGV